MQSVLTDFYAAIHTQNGYALAASLTPAAPVNVPNRLRDIVQSCDAYSVLNLVHSAVLGLHLPQDATTAWTEIYVAYWKAVKELLTVEQAQSSSTYNVDSKGTAANRSTIYEAWSDLDSAIYRAYQRSILPAWTLPCAYSTARYLRLFAIKADEEAQGTKTNGITANFSFNEDAVDDSIGHKTLEDAARKLNRSFALCLNDVSPIQESRKWGIYYLAGLLFKSYFKMNASHLAKGVIKTVQAKQQDLPPLENCPKSHQTVYKYYMGVISFLDEDYVMAERHLQAAYDLCHRGSVKNLQLILTYLIPTRLLTLSVLPKAALLDMHTGLRNLFAPLTKCIKRGDLAGFDAAMTASEDEFVKRRIYLTLERGRDICLRNLIRKVYLAGGYEPIKDGQDVAAARTRRSRVPVAEVITAIRKAGEKDIGTDEAECYLANLIYKVSRDTIKRLAMAS